jgi:hypothetical protein
MNRYCRAGMCLSSDPVHEPECAAHEPADADNREDAARYRWARQNGVLVVRGWPVAPCTPAEWDRHIDGARRGRSRAQTGPDRLPPGRPVLWPDAFTDAWARAEAVLWHDAFTDAWARAEAGALNPPAAPAEQDPPG